MDISCLRRYWDAVRGADSKVAKVTVSRGLWIGGCESYRMSSRIVQERVQDLKQLVTDLYCSLRCQKARRKRYGTYDRRGIIPNQTSIDDRPAIVDAHKRFGDLEGDTVIGKGHRGALVTLVERKSLYTVHPSVSRKTAEAVRHAVTQGLAPHKDRVYPLIRHFIEGC